MADMLKKDGKNPSVTVISGTTAVVRQIDGRIGRHAMTILTRQGVKVLKGSKMVSARGNTSSSSIMMPIGSSADTGLIFGKAPWKFVVWLIKGHGISCR